MNNCTDGQCISILCFSNVKNVFLKFLSNFDKVRKCNKIKIIDVSWLTSEAVKRQYCGESLKELYDNKKIDNPYLLNGDLIEDKYYQFRGE